MSWIFNTGVCSDTADMLDQLVAWVTNATDFPTNIFTKEPVGGTGVYVRTETAQVQTNSPNASFSAQTRCLSRGGVRLWLAHSETNGIFGCTSESSNPIAATKFANTPGGSPAAEYLQSVSGGDHSRFSRCYPVSGANKFWFFASDDRLQVHVRFQRSNGSWQAFSFGKGRKPYPSAWTGGEFFAPQCPSSVVTDWTDPDYPYHQSLFGKSEQFLPGDSHVDPYGFGMMRLHYGGQKFGALSLPPNVGDTLPGYFFSKILVWGGITLRDFDGTPTYYGSVYRNSPNKFNGRSVGVPYSLYLHESQGSGQFQFLCDIPGIRGIALGTAQAEDVVNDDWVIFPQTSPGAGDPTPSTGYVASGQRAVAYYCPGI